MGKAECDRGWPPSEKVLDSRKTSHWKRYKGWLLQPDPEPASSLTSSSIPFLNHSLQAARMRSFQVLSLLSLFLYSRVSSASLPVDKAGQCGVKAIRLCSDVHGACSDNPFLDMRINTDPDYNLQHIPLPGGSAMYQSNGGKLSVQASDPFTFAGKSSIKLQSTLPAGFNAAVVLVNEQDGTQHGFTYKLAAKTAADSNIRTCHHTLPKGFHVSSLKMVKAVQDVA